MDTKQETNCGSKCPCSERCPIGDAIAMIGGRWKLRILCSLNADGTLRYNDLKEKATGITPAMLSASLKELERDGLVTRRQYAEYCITDRGKELWPVLHRLVHWARNEPLDCE